MPSKLNLMILIMNKCKHDIALGNQFLVFKGFCVHDSSQRISEYVGVVTVVVSPLQFLDVAIHMLDAHLVERTHERTLEQTPDAFDTVCVNITHNPFIFRMPNSLMARVVVSDSDIRPHFIRIDGFCFILHGSMNEIMEEFRA